MDRPEIDLLIKDLNKKMVFITGPRQVGKTWLAQAVADRYEKAHYLNYDDIDDRTIITERAWLPETQLLVLDELHKMPDWKNYLKGIYDTKQKKLKILVTGSARLETFRHSGDSLAGRFFRHRLAPFTLSDLEKPTQKDLDTLIIRGGFPEPFLAETQVDVQRWRMQYADGVVRTDILDFERIDNFRALQLVIKLLQKRVGSPVSFSSIARDIQVAPATVKRYIQILEALFIVFRVSPYSRNIVRSLLKEPKIYFYDTGMVEGDKGSKFENFVALSLQKNTQAIEDKLGIPSKLHYLRTKEEREVDFCIVENDEIKVIIEAKLTNTKPDKNLLYFHQKYGFKAVQVVCNSKKERMHGDIEVRAALNYLSDLKP